ncbi:eCIS core domain-containing protein [Nannocystaceae bacterium ST9]
MAHAFAASQRPPAPARAPVERASTRRNPAWLNLALGSKAGTKPAGTKTIGAEHDPLEREADRAAERALAGERAGVSGSAAPLVQRACDRCEADEEAPIQREAESPRGAEHASPSFAGALERRRGGGRPLDDATRARFESSFATRFDDVRVHDDAEAGGMARAIGARAFTHAHDVYLGPTGRGERTLAHELAHVVQQRGGSPTIQRERDPDFTIGGVFGGAASHDDRVYFDYDSATLTSGERARLVGLATSTYAGKTVKLFGRASEEGDPTYNERLAQRRINAVASVLRGRGVNVYETEVRTSDSVGRLDYRAERSVEIRERPTPTVDDPTPTVTSGVDPCAGSGDVGAASGTDLTNCERDFGAAFPRARDSVDAAYTRLTSGTADATRDRVLGELFNGVAPATVTAKMLLLRDFIRTLESHHRCRNTCDPACTRGAMGAGGQVTLCAGFVGRGEDRNVYTLVHESAHATAGLDADDVAYSSARLFQFLESTDAARNTDSYAMLALVLGDTGHTWSYAPTTSDTLPASVTDVPDQRRLRGAVAWLENWLNYCDFDTGLAYAHLVRSMSAWSSGVPGDRAGRNIMEKFASGFGVSDPRTAAHATMDDRSKMAAIHDRYDRMHSVVRRPLELAMTTEGAEHWEPSPGLTGAGSRLWVPPSILDASGSAVDRVKLLLRLLAAAFHDIGPGRVDAYVQGGDDIRQFRGMGPT